MRAKNAVRGLVDARRDSIRGFPAIICGISSVNADMIHRRGMKPMSIYAQIRQFTFCFPAAPARILARILLYGHL